MASQGWRRSMAPAGIMRPQRKKWLAPQSKSWNEKETSYFCAIFSRTHFAGGMTSVPTPSPAITATVKVFMGPNTIVAGTILGPDDAGFSARAAWQDWHACLCLLYTSDAADD